MEQNNENPAGDLDRATAARLAKLRDMPVDLTRLTRTIELQIPRTETKRPAWRIAWPRPLRAAAAAILVVGLLTGLLVSMNTGRVEASVAQMAQMHEDIVAGKTAVTRVSSIEAANKMLAGYTAGLPQVPDVPSEHVMACCMKSVKDKQVACVMLENDGAPITLTVASAHDVRPPASPAVRCNGIECHVTSLNGLNMVMTERNGRWACLISRADSQRLMVIASKLQL